MKKTTSYTTRKLDNIEAFQSTRTQASSWGMFDADGELLESFSRKKDATNVTSYANDIKWDGRGDIIAVFDKKEWSNKTFNFVKN